MRCTGMPVRPNSFITRTPLMTVREDVADVGGVDVA